ncbi:hypothetical protein EDD93_4705 [Streptomyces sp. 840.1]|uniref:hypothetical protein n=1 Tax=Streptomyces sp. 840.1 TaxID=2485152 RepID=UPI000F475C8C|nr:hypothetical protein [Streptomyces sp. 840.1]ROQ70194.1 hypothetical protein EDD93_4705 [Streptomyces sp. 840.1]
MSSIDRSTTRDAVLQEAFGAEVAALYAQAARGEANAVLQCALELRSFLTVAEEHLERVHNIVESDSQMGELSGDDLNRHDQWIEAAVASCDLYDSALDELLLTMPPPSHPNVPRAGLRPNVAATAPPTPAGLRAGAVRAQRP